MLISDTAEGPGTPNPHLRCLTGDLGVGVGFGHFNLIHPKLSLGGSYWRKKVKPPQKMSVDVFY